MAAKRRIEMTRPEIDFIKRCAKVMHLDWMMIAARPKHSEVLLIARAEGATPEEAAFAYKDATALWSHPAGRRRARSNPRRASGWREGPGVPTRALVVSAIRNAVRASFGPGGRAKMLPYAAALHAVEIDFFKVLRDITRGAVVGGKGATAAPTGAERKWAYGAFLYWPKGDARGWRIVYSVVDAHGAVNPRVSVKRVG